MKIKPKIIIKYNENFRVWNISRVERYSYVTWHISLFFVSVYFRKVYNLKLSIYFNKFFLSIDKIKQTRTNGCYESKIESMKKWDIKHKISHKLYCKIEKTWPILYETNWRPFIEDFPTYRTLQSHRVYFSANFFQQTLTPKVDRNERDRHGITRAWHRWKLSSSQKFNLKNSQGRRLFQTTGKGPVPNFSVCMYFM